MSRLLLFACVLLTAACHEPLGPKETIWCVKAAETHDERTGVTVTLWVSPVPYFPCDVPKTPRP